MKTATSIVARSQEENWQPILELALQEVFEIMLGCRLEPPAGSESRSGGEITAMVGLAGSACGVLTVCCGGRTATAIAERMLGAETVRTEDDVCDALGELCNMIAGNFKNKLSGMDGTCMLSVPTVITGGEYSFHSLADGGALETTMLFDGKPTQPKKRAKKPKKRPMLTAKTMTKKMKTTKTLRKPCESWRKA